MTTAQVKVVEGSQRYKICVSQYLFMMLVFLVPQPAIILHSAFVQLQNHPPLLLYQGFIQLLLRTSIYLQRKTTEQR